MPHWISGLKACAPKALLPAAVAHSAANSEGLKKCDAGKGEDGMGWDGEDVSECWWFWRMKGVEKPLSTSLAVVMELWWRFLGDDSPALMTVQSARSARTPLGEHFRTPGGT